MAGIVGKPAGSRIESAIVGGWQIYLAMLAFAEQYPDLTKSLHWPFSRSRESTQSSSIVPTSFANSDNAGWIEQFKCAGKAVELRVAQVRMPSHAVAQDQASALL